MNLLSKPLLSNLNSPSSENKVVQTTHDTSISAACFVEFKNFETFYSRLLLGFIVIGLLLQRPYSRFCLFSYLVLHPLTSRKPLPCSGHSSVKAWCWTDFQLSQLQEWAQAVYAAVPTYDHMAESLNKTRTAEDRCISLQESRTIEGFPTSSCWQNNLQFDFCIVQNAYVFHRASICENIMISEKFPDTISIWTLQNCS